MKRIFLLLSAATVLLVLLPGAAHAHAALARATPSPGAMLDAAPAALSLEFTERLDPAFSRVQLIDAAGTVIAATETVRPEAPATLALALPELGRGSYTAQWRVRSAEDGHITEGTVPFGVGIAADLGAALPPVGAPAPAAAPPPALGVLSRWLALVGAALAVGALGFGLLVWRPAWRQAPAAPEADATMGRGLRRLALAGVGLLILSGPLTLLSQAASAVGPGGNPLAALPALLVGSGGLAVCLRVLFAVALGVLARHLHAPGSGLARDWQRSLAVSVLLLVTFPFTSHNIAAGEWSLALSVAGLIHTAAMVLWLGGLPPLLLAVGHARQGLVGPPLQGLVQRFTPLAIGCVLAIAASGTAQAIIHIGAPDLLLTTTYGRALLVKNVAFIALLGLGALHWLVVSPRIQPGGPWVSRFRSTLAAEIGLGLVVLVAAGVQLNVAPSKTAMEAQAQIGQRLAARAAQVDMTLWLTPGGVGDNLLALDVADWRGGTGGPPQVLFRFEMPGMSTGALQAAASEAVPGRFQARGSYLSMNGRWTIEAIVRRSGMDDVRHTFVVDVNSP